MNQIDFPRYLKVKQSVDDRALNKDVLDALRSNLPGKPLKIIELGSGIGTMVARLIRWDVITDASILLVDEMQENIAAGPIFLTAFAGSEGLGVEVSGSEKVHLFDDRRSIRVEFVQSDIFDFIGSSPQAADLLIAHAFLDLMPMPDSLPEIFSLTKDLSWLTLNFDGVSSFEPVIDEVLDDRIEKLYHATMDHRATGGDSRSGRHLFKYLRDLGLDILGAGSSDWVVYPNNRNYLNDEAYFLECILGFVESSLKGHPDLEEGDLNTWLTRRQDQIDLGEMVYIAHQIDFLVRK